MKRLGFVVTRSNAPPDTPSYPVPSKKTTTTTSPSLFRRLTTWIASLVPHWVHRTTRLHGFSPLWHGLDYGKLLLVKISKHSSKQAQPPCFVLCESSLPATAGVSRRSPLKNQLPNPHTRSSTTYGSRTHRGRRLPLHPLISSSLLLSTCSIHRPGLLAPHADPHVHHSGRTTPMPSLAELTNMFALLPTIPPPLPRRRNPPPTTTPSSSTPASTEPLSLFHYILCLAWLPESIRTRLRPKSKTPAAPPLKPHPFAAIRAGHKSIIIGVADAGMVSFFRFGEGCFEEWPMA